MTQENRTVRQWLSLYQAGAFESRELDDQRTAGWRRFSYRFDALPGRLRQIAPVVARIEQPVRLLEHLRKNEGSVNVEHRESNFRSSMAEEISCLSA